MVAEIFLSAFLEVLFDKLTAHARNLWKLARSQGLEKKLERLAKLFRTIEAVLADAEEQQLTKQAVKFWLDDLKDLAYDAEDVLDEFSTEALRQEVMAKQQAITSKVLKLVPTPSALKFKIEMGSKMDAIASRLEEISKQRSQLSLVENGGGASRSAYAWQFTPTTSSPIEPIVFGRDKDTKNIIDLLLKEDQNCDVIPIFAMGGAGKTTLAQSVYKDRVVAQAFQTKAWVCVSFDFDVSRIMKAILENLTSQPFELKELHLIQARLEDALDGKRFLIVLDDVWDHTFSYNKWLVLRSLFRVGAPGSKMIVTTRQIAVATTMGTINPYRLELLSDEDCWLLFQTHAFNKRDHHVGLHPNIESIRAKIISRCKGLPLAARTLGGLLCCKASDEWEDILNNEIWSMHGDGVLSVLRLSYHYLPPQLKKCFVYCSIFPQDYEFSEKELVLLWIAEGLIQQVDGRMQLIQKGNMYFRELVSRSLIQASSGRDLKFIMHDLVHELAQEVGGQIYLRLDDVESNEKREGNKMARHSSYTTRGHDISKRFLSFHSTEHVRTFLPFQVGYHGDDCWLANSTLQLITRLKKLRVLSLREYKITELPDSIANLKQLRYLDLSCTEITCLPESICSLYNLQIFLLRDCARLRKLPSKMENFINLCYLDITNAIDLQEMPIGLKELKSLKVLSDFIVTKKGCGVKELKNFKDLSGTLRISDLDKMSDAREAREASLNEKNLQVLALEWGSCFFNPHYGETKKCVLDMMHPHKNLKELTISWYGGNAFSTWLGDPSFPSMKILKLQNCTRCICLPPLGQLPSLKTLEISGLLKIKTVGTKLYGSTYSKAFPSLESLSFENMPKWKKWSVFEVNKQLEWFPSLSVLSIKDCPMLVGKLPNHLPSLKKLVVRQCGQLKFFISSFPKLDEIEIDGCRGLAMKRSPTTMCRLPHLRKLNISGCSRFVSLPSAVFLLPVLERVVISDFHNLQTLVDKFDEGFNSRSLSTMIEKKLNVSRCASLECLSSTDMFLALISNLKVTECPMLKFVAKTIPASLASLDIERCSGLTFVGETFMENTKLESITINDCQNFQCLPEGIHLLSCLERISIAKCPNFLFFPQGGLPNHKLKELSISYCKKLEALPNGIRNITSLTSLLIESCEIIKVVPEDGFFTNLTVLAMGGCACMEEILKNLPISLTKLDLFHSLGITSLPNLPISLTQLFIRDCPMFTSLPNLPINLIELDICDCPELTCLPNLPISLIQLRIEDCSMLGSLPSLPISLTQLTISNCPKLISIPNLPISLDQLEIYSCAELLSLSNLPISLVELEITDCPMLRLLPNLPMSLAQLSITACPKLMSLPDLPISLIELCIISCQNLGGLPSNCFNNLNNLQKLEIMSCPKIKSLPDEGLPSSLLELHICDCPMLERRCERNKGKDWHKINDIPCVTINRKFIYDP